MNNLWMFVLCLSSMIAVGWTQVTCPVNMFVTFKMQPERRLVDTTQTDTLYKYENVPDQMSCFHNCKNLTTCESFNFNSKANECEVLNTDDDTKLQASIRWNYHEITCGPTAPTAEPESSPEPEGEPEISMEDILEYFRAHPEFVAMIGMALMIVLLFLIIIVILCCYTGRKRSDDYREKA